MNIKVKRYLDINGKLKLEPYAADVALVHLDRYDRREVGLIHQAMVDAILETVEGVETLNTKRRAVKPTKKSNGGKVADKKRTKSKRK